MGNVDSVGKQPPLWRRPAVFQLLMIALLAEIGYAVLNISTMPVYLKYDRKFGEDVIGLVIVGFLLSEAIFKSYMGHLADRWGRRRLIVLGPALTIATSLLTIAVPHGWGYAESISLLILRVLDGLGAAMLWPAAFALMGDLVKDGERQEAMSYLNSCYLLGIALALPVGGVFNDLFGRFLAPFGGERSPSLYLSALLFIAVVVAAYRFVPSGAEHRANHVESAADKKIEIKKFFDTVRAIPQFITLGLIIFCGIGFPMVIVKLFAKEQFKLSEAQFGFLALPGALAMAVLSVPMSKYAEKIGRVKAVHLGLGLCSLGVGVISLGAFFPFIRSTLAMGLGGIPLGIGFLIAIPAWYASVSEIDCKKRAANIGAVMTAQGLGAIVGAPLGAAAYRHLQIVSPEFGRYSPFLGCAIFVTAGWIISTRIVREPESSPQNPVP